MDQLQLPRPTQLQLLTYLQNQVLPNNFVHLFTGAPVLGNNATYSNMMANEVVASWYASKSQAWFALPINDPVVPGQLDIIGSDSEWNYNNGNQTDSAITVPGYYVTGPSSLLVGYAVLQTPVIIQTSYDGVTTSPFVPLPPLAQ
jgi:hypothetical protein